MIRSDSRFLYYTAQTCDEGKLLRLMLKDVFHTSAAYLTALKVAPEGITVGGFSVIVTLRVKAGDEIRLLKEPCLPNPDIIPEHLPLDIVYEDDDLIAVNKPALIPVHPSRGHQCGTLANYLTGYLPQGFVFRAVNRLDSNTSGLVCVAKHKYAAEKLGSAIKQRALARVYLALVCGTSLPQSGTIDLPIARRPGFGIMREVREDGERAVTHYRVLARGERYSLVCVTLETGRTHQIRVHFAHLGAPIVGDFMYGEEDARIPGNALHCSDLSFDHPLTGARLDLHAPPPSFFEELLYG